MHLPVLFDTQPILPWQGQIDFLCIYVFRHMPEGMQRRVLKKEGAPSESSSVLMFTFPGSFSGHIFNGCKLAGQNFHGEAVDGTRQHFFYGFQDARICHRCPGQFVLAFLRVCKT